MDKYLTPIHARVLLQALLLLLICHATTTQSRIINGIDKDKIHLHGLCVLDKPVLGDYCCKVTNKCYIDLQACLAECNKPSAGMVVRATPPSPTLSPFPSN
ncbi:hypothetical protein VPH35_107584 [Triticum aestivum]